MNTTDTRSTPIRAAIRSASCRLQQTKHSPCRANTVNLPSKHRRRRRRYVPRKSLAPRSSTTQWCVAGVWSGCDRPI